MTETPYLFETLVFLVALAAIAAVIWFSFRQKRRQSQVDAYKEALELIVEGKDRLAIQKFKEAILQDTENVSAYLRLGDLLLKKGLINNAIRIHQDLTLRGNLNDLQRIRIYKSLLLDYEAGEEYEKGIDIAQKILKLDRNPENWVVQKLVNMLEKNGKWKEAEDVVSKYAEILPFDFKKKQALYLVLEGLELQERKNGKDARVKFKEALKKDSECGAAYYYLGKSYQFENRLDDAVKQWRELCKKAPDKAHLVFPELEKAWYEIGRYADAESLYQELLSSNKKELKAGLALAEIYNKKGDYDSALEVLNQLEDEFETSSELIGKKINVYFNKGQYKQAANYSLLYFDQPKTEGGEVPERELLGEVYDNLVSSPLNSK